MRKFSMVALAIVAASAVGCGGDSGPTAPEIAEAVAGTYVLQTVNGQPLPWVAYEEPGYKLELTAGSIVLSESGGYVWSGTLRETDAGVVTTSSNSTTGTYVRNGATITLTDAADGEVSVFTLSGKKLTITEEGDTAVYSK